jgi:hypothetical protein
MKKELKTTTVQLPHELLQAIKSKALSEGRSVASQIRVLLAAAINQLAK